MLFSNTDVAEYINREFEPVWVSLRPVPLVTIDFGNGKVVRRTLHGNVATYACNADGKVLDVLPGIYEPESYLDRIQQLKRLHKYVLSENPMDFESTWRDYHQIQWEQLKANRPSHVLEEVPMVSITGAEGPLEIILRPARRIQARGASARRPTKPSPFSGKQLAQWEALAEDTQINESVRRLAIHKYLFECEHTPRPEAMTKWIYREVLHADLDDPYLGLGKLLFDKYPFAAEDASDP